jgi:putative sterol carrier protein
MSIDELKGMMEACLAKSPEEVKDDLPAIFKKLEQVGIANLISKYPDLLPNVIEKMYAAADAFIQSDTQTKKKMEKIGEMTIGFDYTDAPFKGYMAVHNAHLVGGSYLPDNFDIKLVGPISELIGIISGGGNPMQTMMGGKIKLEGNMQKAMKMMPVMTALMAFVKS